jgi:3-carboxy-cis,cis-muconate cycloisomerase
LTEFITMSANLFDRFLSTREAVDAFSDARIVQAMLDFEAALARAQAAEGVIPARVAPIIAAACRADAFDAETIVEGGRIAGTLAVPLVKQLTAAVARVDTEAAGYVHWGSTSQDVIDTAMVMATQRVLASIDASLGALIDSLGRLAQTHRDTPMLGRTLMQPALVISVGFKLVAWVAPLVRGRARLRHAAASALRLQLGGAVGTRSVMADKGAAVARRMAVDLKLASSDDAAPANAWQTQRDEWVALACEAGLLCGSLGKIATDISLLAQAEVGEIAEPSGGGRGGSSAMPHKRNPVASMVAIAASIRAPHRVAAMLAAMPQQHERGLGNWQAELAEWPGLFMSAHGAASALAEAAAGLSIDTPRMRANIEALQGLVFAEAASMLFAEHVGKPQAHALLETLSRRAVDERRNLLDIAVEACAADPSLAKAVDITQLRAAFDIDAAARRASASVEAQWAELRARAEQPE